MNFCFVFNKTKFIKFKFVHEVHILKKNKQRQIYRNISTPPPRTCNAESEKRIAKGSNFKEDDKRVQALSCF